MAAGRASRLALVAATLVAACSAPGHGPGVADVRGDRHHPLDARGARANVVVFTTVDCPIANGFAPEIRAIAGEYGARGVRFYLVHVDPDVGPTEATAHAEEFGYDLPLLLDPRHELVRAVGATTTPEVAVVVPGGTVAYAGRIDDSYVELGVRRRVVRHHDLREALERIVAGDDHPPVRTVAVGCAIPDLP